MNEFCVLFSGGYYTEKLLNQTGFRVLVLNTNLYYDQNKITENIKDPADQFKWADQVLTEAAKNKEKVTFLFHFKYLISCEQSVNNVSLYHIMFI